MDFEYADEARAFQREVRQFIAENHDSEVCDPRREGMAQLVDTPSRRDFMKKIADQGWLGMSWPTEYGGGGLDGFHEYILNEELAYVGAPYIGKGVGIVGKTLIRHGSEKLKNEFLPKIRAAEIEFAIGYTEPDAGSDLGALSLRADKVDGGWLLNGQKRFTTSAHFADWYWIAARTDSEAEKKHKGITLFLTPMDTPGIQITDMPTIGDERVNEVYLDDVFISDDYVVGEVGKGFYYVSEALDFERFTLYTVSAFVRKYETLRDHIRVAERDGRPLRDDPIARQTIARLAISVELAKVHCMRVIAKAAAGEVPNLEAAMFKHTTTLLGQEIAEAFLEIVGVQAVLKRGATDAPLDGRFEHSFRYTVVDTIGAGTSQVQRNIIARRGLGLPVNNGVNLSPADLKRRREAAKGGGAGLDAA